MTTAEAGVNGGDDAGLRVVRLKVTDFKKLTAVDVQPGPHAVVLAGANAAGKSSVLDAILAALGGKRCCPPRPIRLGADRAEVVLDLGEIEVLRVFTEHGTTVQVRSRDRALYPSPQALLDGLVGPFLDPLAFTRLKPAEQRARLLELLDLGSFDLAASERAEAGAREDRTVATRELKRAQAELVVAGPPPAPVPPEASDVKAAAERLAALTAEAERARALERAAAQAEEAIAQVQADMAALDGQAAQRVLDVRARLAAAEAAAADQKRRGEAAVEAARTKARALHAEREDLTLPNLAAARAALAAAQAVAADQGRRERWLAADARAEARERDVAALDARIAEEVAKRANALATAKLPVDGLGLAPPDSSFGEGLYYRGVPFSQASQAEQLRVSVALAMARQPRLRVLRVQEASVLDPAHLQLLRDLAAEHDWQLWLEVIDPEGADLVIEDGTVQGASAAPASDNPTWDAHDASPDA